jgi:TrmH family RNA methyltransferase
MVMSREPIGKHNPRLAQIRRAFRNGGLTEDGLLPIEGPRLLDEVSKSGVEVRELFVREGEICDATAARSYTVARSVFRSLGATREPQGVIALVRPPTFSLESILCAPKALLIVLCGLQDPGNVGNILRIAEAFQVSGCIATEGTTSQYNDKVVRASAGSLFRMPYVWGVGFLAAVDQIKSRGVRIVGTATSSDHTIEREDWRRPSAILLGNEGAGLSMEELQACDSIVRIPHTAAVDSLNAATAAGIVLYEAARCRGFEAN